MTDDSILAAQAAIQQIRAAVAAHLRGERVMALYLAGGSPRRTIAVLGAAAAGLRAAGQGDGLLTCTGADFAGLWRDTLQRGLTPFVRRALAARQALLLDGLEALRDEPVAQWELARLVAPGRLVILAGRGHLRHLPAWSPVLTTRLAGATSLCLHAGPCVTDADAWTIVDCVAHYYGVTRAALLSRRRTAPIARARQMAMCLLREQGLTYSGRLHDHVAITAFVWCSYQVARCCCLTHGRAA
jgi:hypothetical protein